MFQTKVIEKIKTHILSSATFFFDNLSFYEIIGNCSRTTEATYDEIAHAIACWLPKATNTNSECVTLIAFVLQQWSSLLRYTYIACLVYVISANLKISTPQERPHRNPCVSFRRKTSLGEFLCSKS